MFRVSATKLVSAIDPTEPMAWLPALLSECRALRFEGGVCVDGAGARREGLRVIEGAHGVPGCRYQLVMEVPVSQEPATASGAERRQEQRRGRPTVEITLSDNERETLQRWVRRQKSAQALALRSRIVLACAEGRTDRDIAAELRVNPVTVSKWRHRFADGRLDGLGDAPRPGAARTIGDDVVESVLVDTLKPAPADATHWSTRGLAAREDVKVAEQ